MADAEPIEAAVEQAAPEAPKLRAGWLKSQDGRFHEVEDIDSVMAAYPGQYEEVKASEVRKNLVGWGDSNEA